MRRMNVYAVAADLLLLIHSLFVLFVVFGLLLVLVGGVLGWAWVKNAWFRVVHLAAIVIVVLQAWAGRVCPLTLWEVELRSLGGQQSYPSTFMGYWLYRLLYYDAPQWVFVLAYTLFAALVLACWYWVRPRL